VTGTVSCCSGGNTFNGPDGNGFATGNTDILSFGGISGIVHDSKTMFLVGVFLSDQEPTDPAPERLDFSPAQANLALTPTQANFALAAAQTPDIFTQLAPLLHQVFFIGDGRTDTGSIQQFIVPDNATRLFLGFADALEFGSPSSQPGHYDDNVGQIQAIFTLTSRTTPIPEPNTWLLLSSGLIGIVLWHRRRWET